MAPSRHATHRRARARHDGCQPTRRRDVKGLISSDRSERDAWRTAGVRRVGFVIDFDAGWRARGPAATSDYQLLLSTFVPVSLLP